jgi:hypothetical protein
MGAVDCRGGEHGMPLQTIHVGKRSSERRGNADQRTAEAHLEVISRQAFPRHPSRLESGAHSRPPSSRLTAPVNCPMEL